MLVMYTLQLKKMFEIKLYEREISTRDASEP